MATKAKKKLHPMPPLSTVDRLIYWSLMLLMAAICAVMLVFPFWYWYRNAFREETVIAATMTLHIGWSIFSWCIWIIFSFWFWSATYQKRLPIFGKRNFKYGPPGWPRVYPLFMKNKPPVRVSKHSARMRQRTALLVAILLVIGLLPYPLALQSRHCLHQDGGLSSHTFFNIRTRDYASGEIRQVEWKAYLHRRSKNNPARMADVMLILTTDSGRQYTFDHDEFRGCAWTGDTDWLPAMLELKGRYRPEIITFTGTEHLEKVVLDNHLTPEQQAMLYTLFDR